MEPLNCDDLERPRGGQLSACGALPRAARTVALSLQPRGRHNLAVGLPSPISITIEGNAGYFLGGLGGTRDGTGPDIVVNGFVGWSVGENLMGGSHPGPGKRLAERRRRVPGAGPSSSRATPRCGPGSPSRAPRWPSPATPGPCPGSWPRPAPSSSAATPGTDWATRSTRRSSTWQGAIASLGADAVVEEMTDDDVLTVKRAGRGHRLRPHRPARVTKVASARQLYHFSTHNHGAY